MATRMRDRLRFSWGAECGWSCDCRFQARSSRIVECPGTCPGGPSIHHSKPVPRLSAVPFHPESTMLFMPDVRRRMAKSTPFS